MALVGVIGRRLAAPQLVNTTPDAYDWARSPNSLAKSWQLDFVVFPEQLEGDSRCRAAAWAFHIQSGHMDVCGNDSLIRLAVAACG